MDDYTPSLNDESFTFDLEPYIRNATEKFVAEVDRRIAPEVAAALVKLGWVCMTADELAERDRVVAERAWDKGDAGRSGLPRCPACDDRTVSKHYGGGIPGWRHDDDGSVICGGSFTEAVWKDMNPYRLAPSSPVGEESEA